MIDPSAIVEIIEAASILAEKLLRHARAEAVYQHHDLMNQRDLVAHVAAIVALLSQALETIEREEEGK